MGPTRTTTLTTATAAKARRGSSRVSVRCRSRSSNMVGLLVVGAVRHQRVQQMNFLHGIDESLHCIQGRELLVSKNTRHELQQDRLKNRILAQTKRTSNVNRITSHRAKQHSSPKPHTSHDRILHDAKHVENCTCVSPTKIVVAKMRRSP